MDFRRLQHSYPPRPSPLGTSEPRVDRQLVAPESRVRPESDKPRAYPSANSTPSPSQIYQSTANRGSLAALRGDTLGAYIPSRQGQAHRRYGSLESRNHTQTYRRNNSQPQAVKYREGSLFIFVGSLFQVAWLVPMPRIHESYQGSELGHNEAL